MNGGSSAVESPLENERKKYALVVGVNKSVSVHSLLALQYAESDAKGIGHLLKRRECNFAFPSGLLIGETASTQSVCRAIIHLIDGKSENDLLLFYFIGHGYPVEIDEGKFEVYLVTSDFDPHLARIDPEMYLSLGRIRRLLYQHQRAASVISILDCCDAGFIVAPPSPEKQLAQSLEAFATTIRGIEQSFASSGRTWAVLASSEKGTHAYEHINDHGEDHTLMTSLILDALSGNARDALDRNGNLTLQTLHAYLQTQMEEQQPIMEGKFHVPCILAHHPSENPVLRSPEDYPPSPLKQRFDVGISLATFGDLDRQQVEWLLKTDRIQLQQDYRADRDEQAQMQALGLLRGEHSSYGALLCFGHNPQLQIESAYTRCVYWGDTRRLSGWVDEKEYRRSLLKQFEEARSFLRDHLGEEIPFRVLEEALVNALVHREYVTEPDHMVRTEGVLVEILSDRVEISSPGESPTPLNGSGQGENGGVQQNSPIYSDSTNQSDHSPLGHPSKDFFISYTRVDQSWAEWIAWQLEEAGYTTILQAWDFHAGGNFVLNMNEAIKQAKRTIAVLSQNYLNSHFTSAEWAAAFRRDPKGEQGLLVPVRVRRCDVEGLLGPIVYIDLVGQDEHTAQATLLNRVQLERQKPTQAPTFPRPSFPGTPNYPPESYSPLNKELTKSHPRNPQIMRIFYLVGYVEKIGTGITRMEHWMQEAGLPKPDIRSGQQMFTITLFRPPQPPTPAAQTDVDMPSPEILLSPDEINTQQNGREPIVDNIDKTSSDNAQTAKSPVVQARVSQPRPPDNELHDNRTSQTQVRVPSRPASSPSICPEDQKAANLLVDQTAKRPFPTQVLPLSSPIEDQKAFDDLVGSITPTSPVSKHNKLPTWIVLLAVLTIIVIIVATIMQAMGYPVPFVRHSPTPTPPLGPAPSTTIEIASDFATSSLDTTDGLPLQSGVQMAITETNNNGLLPGYTLKLVPYDDHRDLGVGTNNLKQAVADNLIVGMIGPGNSSVALKELPPANQAPLALLSPSVTFPCLTKSAADDPDCSGTNDIATQMRPSTNQPTFFRLATSDDRQGKAVADLFIQHHSKVLLLKDDSDPYSFGLAQAFQAEWQRGRGLVTSIDLPQKASSVQDYQNMLSQQAAASFQPDLIYFVGDDPYGSYALQALSNITALKTVPFAGGDGIMESSLLQTAANLHREAPIYVSLPIQDPAHSGTPTGADFAINYTTNGYQYYRPYAASAYDCTMTLIQAIKTALQAKGVSTPHGKQDHAGAVQFRQAVLQALRHLSYTGATGTHSFDANGDTTNHAVSFYQADLSTPQPGWTWLQQVNG